MPLLIFSLQHQFVYVRSEGEGEEEGKTFYWQHQGISIGSSASGAIANLALLGGEQSGMVRGELCRYLTRATTEERFESAWARFRGALMTRGYPAQWLDKTRGDLKWADRERVMARMDEKRAAKREGDRGGGAGCEKAVVVVVEAKPGVRAWWEDCRMVEDLLELGSPSVPPWERSQPRRDHRPCRSRG